MGTIKEELEGAKHSLILVTVLGGPFLILAGAACAVLGVMSMSTSDGMLSSALTLLGLGAVSLCAGIGISIWGYRRIRQAIRSKQKQSPSIIDTPRKATPDE